MLFSIRVIKERAAPVVWSWHRYLVKVVSTMSWCVPTTSSRTSTRLRDVAQNNCVDNRRNCIVWLLPTMTKLSGQSLLWVLLSKTDLLSELMSLAYHRLTVDFRRRSTSNLSTEFLSFFRYSSIAEDWVFPMILRNFLVDSSELWNCFKIHVTSSNTVIR